ncbi:hypothetical protein DL98DRAFT_238333, partial [Cadophora sp. DSE1049]
DCSSSSTSRSLRINHRSVCQIQLPPLRLRFTTPEIKETKQTPAISISPEADSHAAKPPTISTMDATDILSNTLNNLSIRQHQAPSRTRPALSQTAPPNTETLQTFTLYPTLPSELRLKILTHTLPSASTLRVKAHILIFDPSFGLYFTFSISRTGYTHARGAFQPVPQPGKTTTELKAIRMVPLLGATKETRTFYLSRHPIVFPSGPNGKGQIRLAKYETLYIDNSPSLLISREFSRAIQDNYRLQEFWTQIENLAIPATSFMHPKHESQTVLLDFVGKCAGLKSLRAVMWDGFRDGEGGDMVVQSLLGCVEGYLEKFRKRLEGKSDEGLEGEEGCRRTPKVEILEV